jgi:phage-related protein
VYAKCLARILALARLGHELRRPAADLLTGGVYELRVRNANVNYRMLYFFCGVHVACLSHGLTKESTVPPAEIRLAAARKKLVMASLSRYTADFGEGS